MGVHRRPLLGGDRIPAVVLVDAPTIAVNAAAGRAHKVTLTASGRVLATPTGGYDGQTLIVTVAQDATGGRTWTLATGYRLPAGQAVVPSTVASRKDKLAVQYDAADDRWDVLAFQPGYGA